MILKKRLTTLPIMWLIRKSLKSQIARKVKVQLKWPNAMKLDLQLVNP